MAKSGAATEASKWRVDGAAAVSMRHVAIGTRRRRRVAGGKPGAGAFAARSEWSMLGGRTTDIGPIDAAARRAAPQGLQRLDASKSDVLPMTAAWSVR